MTLSRRTLLGAVPALAAYASSAHALNVGGVIVEPLLDGSFPLTLASLPEANANAEEAGKLLTAAGLPVGLQLVGRYGADRRLLEIAAAVMALSG